MPMRDWAAGAVTGALVAAGILSGAAERTGAAPLPRDGSVVVGAVSAWRPYATGGPVPTMKVWVDGRPIPGDCLLDTGSPLTLLSQDTASAVPLQPVTGTPSLNVFGVVAGATMDAVPMKAQRMGNADWLWPEVTVWVVPRSGFGCIIGTDYPAPIVEHATARREALERYALARAASGS